MKFNPDGSLARLKSRLMAKGYSEMYGIDCQETFSLMAKLISVRLLISFAAIHQWSLHKLDIKNTFLYGILDEEVYIE